MEVTSQMRGKSRVLRVLLIGQMTVLGGMARAQEPAAPPAPPSQVPGTPGGERPTIELSLDEAVKRSLESNADIVVEKYDPLIAEQNVKAAEGYYDPFLSAVLSKTSQDQKASNAFTGGTSVSTDTKVWNFGVNQYVPTGGIFNLTFN